jgi:branched-chain amino acid aminotransferase
MPNTRGELCEGTGSNVFVVVDGALVTPPLSSGCLAGITRELVLEWCADQMTVAEQDLPLEVLRTAEEVFITSSTRNVQPVSAIVGGGFDRVLEAPGPISLQAAEIFAQRSSDDLDP